MEEEEEEEDYEDEQTMNTPESKTDSKKKRKTAKQTTLKSSVAQNKETKNSMEKTEEKTPKKTGFTLWLEENRSLLAEENPDVSDGDLIKISMKRWRSLADEEKSEWNEKATGIVSNSDEKKRKRENAENNENDKKITNTACEKSMKKLKCSDSASNKLAGFAYSKS
ncbi:hypothetical protein QZH41_003256 [Actinostola sp. cb2023]|nr:hypothetical protein QZH41_003256 [Actinostola sp. cb2023]